MIDWFMNGKSKKKKQTKDPLRELFDIKPSHRTKPKSNIVNQYFLSGFLGQGHPRPDRKTKQQKQFLNKTRMGTGKSHKRFWDHDGDGVISGLDCMPMNSKKHRANKMIRERLKNVNLWMTDYPTEGELRDSRRVPPSGDQIFWADINSQKGRVIQNTIKKYPGLLSKMEDKYPKKTSRSAESITISDLSGREEKMDGSYTTQGHIYVYRGFTEKDPIERADILFHELRHREQDDHIRAHKEDDDDTFDEKYLTASRIRGYTNNPFEIDARIAAKKEIISTHAAHISPEELQTAAELSDNIEYRGLGDSDKRFNDLKQEQIIQKLHDDNEMREQEKITEGMKQFDTDEQQGDVK
jgi:hypothetical protein